MGMTIDKAIKEIESITVVTDEKQALAFALAVHTMKKYQMMQADYENRLKADMVAMLTELQLEIEEMENPYTTRVSGCAQGGFERGARESQNLIQQKINSLKEA